MNGQADQGTSGGERPDGLAGGGSGHIVAGYVQPTEHLTVWCPKDGVTFEKTFDALNDHFARFHGVHPSTGGDGRAPTVPVEIRAFGSDDVVATYDVPPPDFDA